MKFVYGLLALTFLVAPALADDAVIERHTDSPFYVDGKLLLAMCSADPTNTNGPDMCEAYLAGIIDTIVSNRDEIQGYHICWPQPSKDLKTMRGEVVDYLKAHPEMSPGVAASIVNSMLFEHYRCPGTQAPPD
jgi:hypothetical protein